MIWIIWYIFKNETYKYFDSSVLQWWVHYIKDDLHPLSWIFLIRLINKSCPCEQVNIVLGLWVANSSCGHMYNTAVNFGPRPCCPIDQRVNKKHPQYFRSSLKPFVIGSEIAPDIGWQ